MASGGSHKIISATCSCSRRVREALFGIKPQTFIFLLWSGCFVPLCIPPPLLLLAEKAEADGLFASACESLCGGSRTLYVMAIASGHGGSLPGDFSP